MKRICHITSAHGRYDTRIFQKECRSLAKEGYEVYLLVNDKNKNEVIEKVKIISTGYLPKSRLERFFVSHRKLLKKALRINADIYHFHDPDLLPLGLKLKKRQKAVIFDSHENVREDIKDKEYISKAIRGIVSRVYSIYEGHVLKYLDAVIGVDPQQMVLLNKIGNNATMITNYPELLNESQKKNAEKKGICFAGGINAFWSHEKILNILEKANVDYKLCGTAQDSYLASLKKHRNWKYVSYKGFVKHEDVLGILESSIAGMALLKKIHNLGQDGTLGNTKIFEYMRAGIPVILTDFPLWRKIVDTYYCGIPVDINNEKEITDAVIFLCNNPEKAEKMGENGRRAFLEVYNWETQVPVLINLYKKLEKGNALTGRKHSK